MPPVNSVQRQSPKPVAQNSKPLGKPGSILSTAVSVNSLDVDDIQMVLYGLNRTGKTTLACQFPKPLLLVSFEPNKSGGAKSVKKMQGVTYLRITTKGGLDHNGKVQEEHGMEKAVKLARELEQHNPFKTIVLDTATSLQDLILQQLLDLPSIPEQMSWGMVSKEVYFARSEQVREALRPYTNLRNCNLIIVAKEKDHNPPQDFKKGAPRFQPESFFAASLGGATVDWLHDVCDYICRLWIDKEVKGTKTTLPDGTEDITYEETGRMVRRLRTMLHNNYAGGFRSENPEAVPEYIEAHSPREMYEAILEVIAGKKTVKGFYPK